MMISPETYYEFELKGKTVEEIKEEIRALKEEIAQLKYKMEDPCYQPGIIHPSDDTVLYWTREYLATAKRALVEAGGEYEETEEDRRASIFRDSLPFLMKLEFDYGGFGSYDPIIINCDSEKLHWSENHIPCIRPDSEIPHTRTELLNRIRDLHLEEWQTDYWPDKYGICVMDGIQWELKLEYSNGHETWKAFGSNAYPFNFREFMEMLGADYRLDDYEELETENETDDEA